MTKKINPKAQAALDRVLKKFQSGDLGPIVQVVKFRLPPNHPATKWSLRNQVFAAAQSMTLDIRGYNQWKQVGRHVNQKGAQVYIWRPQRIPRKVKSEDDDAENNFFIRFYPIPVYPANATEGDPAGLAVMEPRELPDLITLARNVGIAITYTPTSHQADGLCTPDGSKIALGTNDAPTAFHELGHAIQAKIQGGLKGRRGSDEYAMNEVIAEFTATVLAELYGYSDHTGNAWRYITSYAEKPMQALYKALDTVKDILAYLELESVQTPALSV